MESIVILKSGEEMPASFVGEVFYSLQSLFKQYPVPFVELVSLARNPKHELFGRTGNILREMNFLESGMSLRDDVRLIVLAATEGEGLDLHIVLPIRVFPGHMTGI
jgi:hypothetical protein